MTSKTTNLQLAAADGGGRAASSDHSSSWITRLLPRPINSGRYAASTSQSLAPASTSNLNLNLNLNTSFFVRRYLNLPSHPPSPPPPPPPPPIPVPQAADAHHLTTGFGPFQVRNRSAPSQRDLDYPPTNFQHAGLVPNDRAGLRLPRSLYFRPRSIDSHKVDGRINALGEGATESVENGPSFSWSSCFPRPAQNPGKRVMYLRPESVDGPERANAAQFRSDLRLSAAPAPSVSRIRGAHYQGVINDPSTSRSYSDLPALHRTPRSCPEGQTSTNLDGRENFSYWNMGNFKKTTLSSVSPASALVGNLGRKRNPNADAFISSKSRKLGNEY